jgi:nucleoid-associated protein Lsr2
MAQKVLVQLVDDLDGTTSDSVSTVQFGLDGVTYEIDLTDSNAEALRGLFSDYVNSGRRTGGRVKRGSGAGRNGSGNNDASQIREWAQANGIELAARGRIPAHVAESYREAQKDDKVKTAPAKRRTRTKKG